MKSFSVCFHNCLVFHCAVSQLPPCGESAFHSNSARLQRLSGPSHPLTIGPIPGLTGSEGGVLRTEPPFAVPGAPVSPRLFQQIVLPCLNCHCLRSGVSGYDESEYRACFKGILSATCLSNSILKIVFPVLSKIYEY